MYDYDVLRKVRQSCWICRQEFSGTGIIHTVELEAPLKWKICPECLADCSLNCLVAVVWRKNRRCQVPEHVLWRLGELLKAALEGHILS